MYRQPMSICIRPIAALTCGLVAVGPAVAAPTMPDIDWGSYFNPNWYADWHSTLLFGSIVLLLVAVLAKVVEASRTTPASGRVPTPIDRIGTMPIEPPESIASGERNALELGLLEDRRIRPLPVASPELATTG